MPHSANTGKFVLTVADGQGEVVLGGSGELRLNIRGLAPLYTGLFNAHQLQVLGLLSGAEDVRAIATQIFAGLPPGHLISSKTQPAYISGKATNGCG